MDEELEPRGVWYSRTIGYVVLAVIVTFILGNAIQSFFFEKIIPGLSPVVGGVIGAVIAARRRRLLASNTTENTQ